MAADPSNASAPPRGRGSFFGRRKGKTLRAHHSELLGHDLPQVELDLSRPFDAAASFPHPVVDVHLEIGFGGGEHLAQRAGERPDVGFIGCEAYVNGMAKMLALAEKARLTNVRLWADDAAAVIDWLPDASIGRAYLLYPDPWPKRRHRKRRFLGEAMIPRLGRVLRPGAELCFATDIDDYSAYALARIARSNLFEWTAGRPGDWQRPWEGWRSTRYEAKALREGRVPTYMTFRRTLTAAVSTRP